MTAMDAPKRAPTPRAASARSCGERSFAGVLIRSRTRKTAVADILHRRRIDAVRNDEPRQSVFRLAVAVEAVAREREGERRKLRLVDIPLEPVGAGGKHGREPADEERVALRRVGAAEPEEHAAEIALRVGDQAMPARLGLEAGGRGEAALARVEARRAPRRAPPPSPG